MSETPYFKWAAHDDLLAPGFLAACVEALDRDPAAVLASPGSTLIDETGARLPHSPERGGMVDRAGVCWPVLPEKRSEERRVGKECVRPCRSRWSPSP